MQTRNETQGEKETGRLEAFSDGVFAIAITLLVLELKVPSIPPEGITSAALGKALLKLWRAQRGFFCGGLDKYSETMGTGMTHCFCLGVMITLLPLQSTSR